MFSFFLQQDFYLLLALLYCSSPYILLQPDFSSNWQAGRAFLSFYSLYLFIYQIVYFWPVQDLFGTILQKWLYLCIVKENILWWVHYRYLFYYYLAWVQIALLRVLFFINTTANAINKLERTLYYQESHVVEDNLVSIPHIRSQLHWFMYPNSQVL